MALLLRVLDKTTYIHWLDARKSPSWCGEGELPALLLSDFADNELSFYELKKAEHDATVLSAFKLAQMCESVDYIVFEDNVLKAAGLKYRKTPGNTGVEVVDRLHVEVTELTASKVIRLVSQLVDAMRSNQAQTIRKKKSELQKLRVEIMNKSLMNFEQPPDTPPTAP